MCVFLSKWAQMELACSLESVRLLFFLISAPNIFPYFTSLYFNTVQTRRNLTSLAVILSLLYIVFYRLSIIALLRWFTFAEAWKYALRYLEVNPPSARALKRTCLASYDQGSTTADFFFLFLTNARMRAAFIFPIQAFTRCLPAKSNVVMQLYYWIEINKSFLFFSLGTEKKKRTPAIVGKGHAAFAFFFFIVSWANTELRKLKAVQMISQSFGAIQTVVSDGWWQTAKLWSLFWFLCRQILGALLGGFQGQK